MVEKARSDAWDRHCEEEDRANYAHYCAEMRAAGDEQFMTASDHEREEEEMEAAWKEHRKGEREELYRILCQEDPTKLEEDELERKKAILKDILEKEEAEKWAKLAEKEKPTGEEKEALDAILEDILEKEEEWGRDRAEDGR